MSPATSCWRKIIDSSWDIAIFAAISEEQDNCMKDDTSLPQANSLHETAGTAELVDQGANCSSQHLDAAKIDKSRQPSEHIDSGVKSVNNMESIHDTNRLEGKNFGVVHATAMPALTQSPQPVCPVTDSRESFATRQTFAASSQISRLPARGPKESCSASSQGQRNKALSQSVIRNGNMVRSPPSQREDDRKRVRHSAPASISKAQRSLGKENWPFDDTDDGCWPVIQESQRPMENNVLKEISNAGVSQIPKSGPALRGQSFRAWQKGKRLSLLFYDCDGEPYVFPHLVNPSPAQA